MPSTLDRAVAVTRETPSLALLPVAATLLSLSKLLQALSTDAVGCMTFPFPTGLPTLWTYVSLPTGPGGVPVGGPGSLTLVLPLFMLGLLVTSALEAGFLGSLDRRLDGRSRAFVTSIRRFTLRMVGVNLVRIALVLVALPFLAIPPLAIVIVLALSYFVYGLPFALVADDCRLGTALSTTVHRALAGGRYAAFGFAHLLVGGVASFFLTSFVLGTGIVGIAIGLALVAVPAVVVAAYGLLLFRDGPTARLSSLSGR